MAFGTNFEPNTILQTFELCLKANTALAGQYAIGDVVKLIKIYNVNTIPATLVSELAYNETNGGATLTTPLTAANFDECVRSLITVDTYRIAGNVAVATSTPSNAPASVPVVGTTVTISPPYKSLSWNFLRETSQDPGTGAVAKLTVNGFDYYAGSGPQYQTVGQNLQTANGELFNTTYTFTAVGTCFVEIVVTK